VPTTAYTTAAAEKEKEKKEEEMEQQIAWNGTYNPRESDVCPEIGSP
jgi:hypothetical protein